MSLVESYILGKEGQQQKLLWHLHLLILNQPGVTDKIRYKIPFYYRKSWVCYLNPVSNAGIELAFLRGNELSNQQQLLSYRNRKQVMGAIFYNVKDVPDKTVVEIVQEALILDEVVPYKSKRS